MTQIVDADIVEPSLLPDPPPVPGEAGQTGVRPGAAEHPGNTFGLHHPPGHAQVDFGEAVVEVGGQREKVAFFCLILPHSDLWFVKTYPRETTEAFLDGHVSAFRNRIDRARVREVAPNADTIERITERWPLAA